VALNTGAAVDLPTRYINLDPAHRDRPARRRYLLHRDVDRPLARGNGSRHLRHKLAAIDELRKKLRRSREANELPVEQEPFTVSGKPWLPMRANAGCSAPARIAMRKLHKVVAMEAIHIQLPPRSL
jgi:hypothetical protein